MVLKPCLEKYYILANTGKARSYKNLQHQNKSHYNLLNNLKLPKMEQN
jgi:hypothetical protein